MSGYKRLISIIVAIFMVFSALQVNTLGKSTVMAENDELISGNVVLNESDINSDQINNEVIQVEEQKACFEETVGTAETSVMSFDETEPVELSDAGELQNDEDMQVIYENEGIVNYNSEDVLDPKSDESGIIETSEMMEETVGLSEDEESGIEENEDQGGDTEDQDGDIEDQDDDTESQDDDSEDVYDDPMEHEDDDLDELVDPGFIITGLMECTHYDEYHHSYSGHPAEISTTDGEFNGIEIKNLNQKVTTKEDLSKPELADKMVLAYTVADPNRVKVYVDDAKTDDFGYIWTDLSYSRDIKVTVVVDEKESVVYTVTLEHQEVQLSLSGFGYSNRLEPQTEWNIEFKKDDVNLPRLQVLNEGYKAVTGLTATLKNAKNIRISEESFIGLDEQGITLEPFNNDWLSDLARKYIVFMPTGTGEISGELTISCNELEDITIKLTGESQWGSDADEVKQLIKYVAYSFVFDEKGEFDSCQIEGSIPDGMIYDSQKRELYGAPVKEGQYDFSVIRNYHGKETVATYSLNVFVNSNLNVAGANSDGFWGDFELDQYNYPDDFEYLDKVSTVIKKRIQNPIYVSEGEYKYYVKVWLNGNELEEGTDYKSESGSTRITLLSQTLQNKCNKITQEDLDSRTYGRDNYAHANTLCVEFNLHPNKSIRGDEYFRVSCQNFYVVEGDVTPVTEPESTDYTTTIDVSVADGSGNTMSGYIVELHSEVQTAKTDASGNAKFASVEMGSHALYVKKSDGSVAAERHFTLVPGEQTSYDGDTITVARGDTVKLNVTVASEQKTTQTIVTETKSSGSTSSAKTTGTPKPTITKAATSAKANNAKTGDNNNVLLFLILIGASVSVLTLVRRKSSS